MNELDTKILGHIYSIINTCRVLEDTDFNNTEIKDALLVLKSEPGFKKLIS